MEMKKSQSVVRPDMRQVDVPQCAHINSSVTTGARGNLVCLGLNQKSDENNF